MSYSTWFRFFAVVSLAAALPIACANGTQTIGGGSGGDDTSSDGGSSSSVTSTTTATTTSSTSTTGTGGGGGQGPCVMAIDCAWQSDACNTGTCINGTCEKTPANDNASCDDGKNCTQNDSCLAGVCSGTQKPCSAADSCHVGWCDVASDECVQMPGNDGASCVDDDPCTLTGVCSSGECAPGQLIDCSFLDGTCSQGSCDPQIGCVVEPLNDGSACDDGFYCTVNDACSAGLCTGVTNTCAAPGDVCLMGTCDEFSKSCVAVAGNNGGSCNDFNTCTSGETCSNGSCGGGLPVNQGVACNDHDACTAGEACSNGACVGAPIVACVNGDGCCAPGCTNLNDNDCTCLGWVHNGGCWYTSSDVNFSCSQVCAAHGGVDMVHTQHAGNDIGKHFWPNKADGSNWVSIECSSTDNNTNWGADGSAPDVNFTHPACYVNCACAF